MQLLAHLWVLLLAAVALFPLHWGVIVLLLLLYFGTIFWLQYQRQQQQQSAQQQERDQCQDHSMMLHLLQQTVDAFQQESTLIKDDLTQVKQVIADAVSQLNQSFYQLQANSDGQKRAAHEMIAAMQGQLQESEAKSGHNANIKEFVSLTAETLASI